MRSQAVVVALLTVGLGVPLAASPAAAEVAVPAAPAQEDGLETRTKATYVVDPAAAAIRVTVEVTLANQIPDRNRNGVIEQAYFSEIGVPVLTEAANFVAAGGAGPLTVTAQDIGNPYVRSALVDLEPNLFYGQSQTVKLTYDLPNQRPRSPGVSRANDAFVAFPAFTFGDAGLSSVEVRLPKRYEVEVVGAELEETTQGDQKILSAQSIEDPDGFIAFVVGTDEAKLVSKPADTDGAEVVVRAWPDDAEWADFAAKQVADAKPVLEELVGLPWPRDDELAIVESASPYAYGYAGWYDEADHAISVGDELDPRVMVHELSHVWFNSRLFADRWVAEGFAEEYATTALEELDQPQDGPAAPDRRAAGAVALNDWSDPFLLDETSEATELFGYAASWYIVDQIAQEVGVEKLRGVLDAVADQRITYTGDPDPESFVGVADWQRLLDLLEGEAGSAKAPDLWDTFVVNDAQRAELAARTTARTTYDELVASGDGWTPPLEVRRVMAEWNFGALDDAVAEAEDVLAVRDDIEAALTGLDVEDLGLEEAYETAEGTQTVLPVARETLHAAEAYAAADEQMDEGVGFLGEVGLLWSGTDGRLDTARRELEAGDPGASLRASAAVEQSLDDAARDGALRVGGVVLVGGGGLFALWRIRRWRRRRRKDKVERAERSAEAKLAALPSLPQVEPLSSLTGKPRTPPPLPPMPPTGPTARRSPRLSDADDDPTPRGVS